MACGGCAQPFEQGTIYVITTIGGLVRYRPGDTPPPVEISDVTTDRRQGRVAAASMSSATALAAFEFRATSFKTRPEALLFRYRLAGRDDVLRAATVQRLHTPRPMGQGVGGYAAGWMVEEKVRQYGLGRGQVDPVLVGQESRSRLLSARSEAPSMSFMQR